MAKLKDGFYKQTAESVGSDLYVLLAGGGSKPLSDFATASDIPTLTNYYWANVLISATSKEDTAPTFGSVKINTTSQVGLVMNSSNIANGIRFDTSNSSKGWVGWDDTNGTSLYNYSGAVYFGIKPDGTPHYKGHDLRAYVLGSAKDRTISTSTDLNTLTGSAGGWWGTLDNTTYTNGPYQNFGLLSLRLNNNYWGQLSLPYSSPTLPIKYRSLVWSSSGNVWQPWLSVMMERYGRSVCGTEAAWSVLAGWSTGQSTELGTDVTLYLHSSFSNRYGYLHIRVRRGEYLQARLLWSVNIDVSKIRVYYSSNYDNIQVAYLGGESYSLITAELVADSDRGGSHNNRVACYHSYTAPSYTSYITPTYDTLQQNISGNASSATKLATGRYLWGNYFNGEDDVNGDIYYKGSLATNRMIQFLNNTSDAYGNGIAIGGGGLTVIGGGESAGLITASTGASIENLVLSADEIIEFYSNCQSALSSAYKMTFDKVGDLHVPSSLRAKQIFANSSGSGNSGGVSLYSNSSPDTYGIMFRLTGNSGTHGKVTSDWATYFTMNDQTDRGWIFKRGSTNVASISGGGVASFTAVGTDKYISYPSGGLYTYSSGNITGAIKITLPVRKSSTMIHFKVTIYNYYTGTSSIYYIAGYNYSDGNWYNCTAYSLRQGFNNHGNQTVRFGNDGTKDCIWIGETNTTWSYPNIVISDILLGHSSQYVSSWASGWSIDIKTSFDTVYTSISNPAINNDLGYIGTTAVQASSATQNLTGIGSINMAGDILVASNGDTGLRQIRLCGGSNDFGRIAVGATAANAGWMEIATADDATEPIYVRQYSGTYTTLTRTLTLLDASGNTTIPNTLSVNGYLNLAGNKYHYHGTCGINMNNSDIIGVNSIVTLDLADSGNEGIKFYRDATHVDSLWAQNGNLYFNQNMDVTTDGCVNGTNRTVIHSGNIGSQSVNYASSAGSAGYLHGQTPLLCAASESDNITIVANSNGAITTNSPMNLAAIRKAIDFKWYDTHWLIGNIRSSNTDSAGFGITYGGTNLRFRVTTDACYVGSNVVIHTGNIGSQSVNYASSAGNADTVDSWHKTYFPIGWDGSRHYRIHFGLGSLDLNWKKIAETTSNLTTAPTSNHWAASSIKGKIYRGTDNYYSGLIIEYPFMVTFHYTSGTSLIDTATLYLPKFATSYDNIRVVRVSTNKFELQVRMTQDWRHDWIEFLGVGTSLTCYESLQTANTTGTVVCTAATASTLTLDKASYAYTAGSAPASDVYAWAKAATKPSYSFSEITPGVATIGDGANRLMFRTHASWISGMYYSTPGNESMVFANVNPVASWIFATANATNRPDWTGLTPSLQIKNLKVAINKLIASGSEGAYNLDVNGSANATTLYENGTRVSVSGHTHAYLPLAGGTMTGNITFGDGTQGAIKYGTHTTSALKGITLPSLGSAGIGIFSRAGKSTDEGGIIITEDACLIYNSFDTGWGFSVHDKDLNQEDISGDNTKVFGITQTGYYTWSRGGFKKEGSSDSYVLLGGGGHKAESSLSVSYASSSGSANGLASTGYGNSNLTYYQTDGSFFGNSGWSHYIIASHGDGSSYYNFTIGLPFWGVPIYKRLEGGTADGWHTFITSENISSLSVNYAASAGNADTVDSLHVHSGRNNEVNKIVRTDANGYILAGWINTTSGEFTGTPTRIYASDDGYIRYMSPVNFYKNTITSGSGDSSRAILFRGGDGKPYYTTNIQIDADSKVIKPSATNSGSLGLDGVRWKTIYAYTIYAATAFYQSSDASLKTNIKKLSKDLLDRVYNINEVSFNWKESGKEAFGYIALDYEVISKTFVDRQDDGTLTLDYTKALVAQIAALKLKIVNLEERLRILERS